LKITGIVSSLIRVCPTNSGLVSLINPPQIIYVLNQHRIDRQGQIVQKKFIELAGPVSNQLIPFERRIDSLQVGTQHGIGFWRSNTFTRQVEKIANQL
jgi:hypothetical protein